MADQPSPADSVARHWTAWLPAAARPYAQLSRLDRPIGWQLLLLPCWMGMAIVRTQDGFWSPDQWRALFFLIGAIAMRGAGCTYNDMIDRHIDAAVERTRGRPIPSGAVSLQQALFWMLVQCGIGLWVLFQLPEPARWIALASLPLIALYPFMKRITWWPQVWLGIVFSWGALVGGATVSALHAFLPETVALYVGCVFWVIAYDTIYALQDKEDDALIGVRSTARLFGSRWRDWTMGFYAAALFFWAVALWFAGAPWPIFLALALIGGGLIWPIVQSVKDDDPASALAAFKANALIGLAVLAAFMLEPVWTTLRPILSGN
jgi:4-hydroxybenzoate polyprenyltransferase